MANRALIIFSVCLVICSGCAKSGPADKDAIAYVNKEPVLKSELDREMALRQRHDPDFKITPETKAEQLDTIIDRKLIVQKAMENGLAREDRFVNTIKAYWEQTLIRNFLEYKEREFKDYIFAAEEEIKNYYDNLPNKDTLGTLEALRPEITKRIAAEKSEKLFEDWLKNEKSKASIRIINKP